MMRQETSTLQGTKPSLNTQCGLKEKGKTTNEVLPDQSCPRKYNSRGYPSRRQDEVGEAVPTAQLRTGALSTLLTHPWCWHADTSTLTIHSVQQHKPLQAKQIRAEKWANSPGHRAPSVPAPDGAELSTGNASDTKHHLNREERYREAAARGSLHGVSQGPRAGTELGGQCGWSHIDAAGRKAAAGDVHCNNLKATVTQVCVRSLLTLHTRASLNRAIHYKKFLQILKCIKVVVGAIRKVKNPQTCSQRLWKAQNPFPHTAVGFGSDTTSFST